MPGSYTSVPSTPAITPGLTIASTTALPVTATSSAFPVSMNVTNITSVVSKVTSVAESALNVEVETVVSHNKRAATVLSEVVLGVILSLVLLAGVYFFIL